MSETNLYGSIKEMVFSIRNPQKTITFRQPTNSEWIERMRDQRMTRTDLGRRKSQSTFVPNPKADMALLNKITLNVEGEPFDADEAVYLIGILSSAKVTDSGRSGDGYFVDLSWSLPGGHSGTTRHLVRVPTMAEIGAYKSRVVSVFDLPHNVSEIKFNTDAAVSMYDSIVLSNEGYSSGHDVPPTHKQPVVSEVIQIFEAELADDNLGF